jgi:hypothetical protein
MHKQRGEFPVAMQAGFGQGILAQKTKLPGQFPAPA